MANPVGGRSLLDQLLFPLATGKNKIIMKKKMPQEKAETVVHLVSGTFSDMQLRDARVMVQLLITVSSWSPELKDLY
jgi:hypothetical protein